MNKRKTWTREKRKSGRDLEEKRTSKKTHENIGDFYRKKTEFVSVELWSNSTVTQRIHVKSVKNVIIVLERAKKFGTKFRIFG